MRNDTRFASWIGRVGLAALLAACGEGTMTGSDLEAGDVGEGDLTGIDEDEGLAFSSTLAPGDYARVCTSSNSGLRQRSGPGTGYSILRTMPEGSTTKILSRDGSWYRNDWGGRVGWSHGAYLCEVSGGGGGGSLDAPTTRDGVLAIAQATVGFSYWWGGAAFKAGASHGACYGSCPGCSHSGSYGADCSGYVGKVWKLSAAMPMESNRHPYSTYHYYNNTTHWRRISRGNTVRADAMVYNQNGAGHIFLFERGEPWGSMWTYESRGCSYGVVHNVRTAGSAYRAIRRDGF